MTALRNKIPKLALLVASLALATWQLHNYWTQFEGLDFYFARSEYLFLHSMPRWKKEIFLRLPMINYHAKEMLKHNMASHVSSQEYYDPAKHDRPYRHVVKDVLSTNECARLRSLLLRQKSLGGYVPVLESLKAEVSLAKEFGEASLPHLLKVYGPTPGFDYDIKPEETAMLYDIMGRIQRIAESKLNSSTIFMEYAGITVRRNPIAGKRSYDPERLHYRTTGGHGMHADQCMSENSVQTYWDGWTCNITKDHCCQQRTHSILLYLNDPSDNDLVGGDLYVVDRTDLLNDTVPSYSGIGFAKLLQKTVRLEPTCGNLILFSSDARNFHGTYPIESGARLAMPMWWTLPREIPDPSITNDEDWEFTTRQYCHAYSDGILPCPSGLTQYKDDCDGMIEAIRREAYSRKQE